MNSIGEKIKEYRTSIGMTQQDFAYRLGVTGASVSAYENGTRMPSFDVLIRIANILGVTTDDLLGRKKAGVIVLDITDLTYKGMNMTFLAKPGLEGRNQYDTNGQEAQRSIMGGLFFTCGLENICAPCMIDGKDYPMHGRMRTTPAEHVCTDVLTDGDEVRLVISGEMREAELFGGTTAIWGILSWMKTAGCMCPL